MLGYAFMGKAHSSALLGAAPRRLAAAAAAAPRRDRRAGRDPGRQAAAATGTSAGRRTGASSSAIPRSASSTTAVPTAPTRSRRSRPPGGQARGVREAARARRRRILRDLAAVAATGVKHLCGFNFRFVPAVRLARELIDAGELGEIRHFRARYLQDWGDNPAPRHVALPARGVGLGRDRRSREPCVDLARFLVGEIDSVSALVKTFVEGRQVDDAVEAVVEFPPGPVGTIEATRLALGRRNAMQWEINGSKGSLWFDMERLQRAPGLPRRRRPGARCEDRLVSEADHPFIDYWWPPGHIIGWGDTFPPRARLLPRRDRRPSRGRPLRRHLRGRLPRRSRSAMRSCAPAGRRAARRSPTARSPASPGPAASGARALTARGSGFRRVSADRAKRSFPVGVSADAQPAPRAAKPALRHA